MIAIFKFNILHVFALFYELYIIAFDSNSVLSPKYGFLLHDESVCRHLAFVVISLYFSTYEDYDVVAFIASYAVFFYELQLFLQRTEHSFPEEMECTNESWRQFVTALQESLEWSKIEKCAMIFNQGKKNETVWLSTVRDFDCQIAEFQNQSTREVKFFEAKEMRGAEFMSLKTFAFFMHRNAIKETKMKERLEFETEMRKTAYLMRHPGYYSRKRLFEKDVMSNFHEPGVLECLPNYVRNICFETIAVFNQDLENPQWSYPPERFQLDESFSKQPYLPDFIRNEYPRVTQSDDTPENPPISETLFRKKSAEVKSPESRGFAIPSSPTDSEHEKETEEIESGFTTPLNRKRTRTFQTIEFPSCASTDTHPQECERDLLYLQDSETVFRENIKKEGGQFWDQKREEWKLRNYHHEKNLFEMKKTAGICGSFF